MNSVLKPIRTMQDVADLVEDIGFLPFFNNAMPGYGFSIEEQCVPEKWFGEDDGPWEWKGPLIRQTGAAYGKLFRTKAGFVSSTWFADLANMRGGLMAFEERWDLGLASDAQRVIYELLENNGPLLTKEIRRMGGFGSRKGGDRPGFETALTRLQMLGYMTTLDIEYERDKHGHDYGWGVARMALVEQALPFDLDEAVEGRSTDESRERILRHLEAKLPHVPASSLAKLMELGGSPVRSGRTDRRGKERHATSWLVPANPRYFDLEAHLSASDEVLWKQSTSVQPGDEVFLYITAPASEVRYRFVALECDLPATGTYEIRVDRLMRLRLVERLDPPITRAELAEQGITHVRGPRKLPQGGMTQQGRRQSEMKAPDVSLAKNATLFRGVASYAPPISLTR